MVLNWFFKGSSQDNKKIAPEESRRIIARFNELSQCILTLPTVLSVIGFDEALSYFESDRPVNPNLKKDAIIRKTHHEGQLLAQVFLDGDNELLLRPDGTPYGRQFVAQKLDKQFLEAFGDKDLIIVEQKTRKNINDEFHLLNPFQFSEWLRDILKIQELVPVITYESAIQYFVTDRPTNPKVKKGAILRQHHPQGYHLVQVFLDKNNQLVRNPDGKPYGRQLVTREIDEELSDTFGTKDLIIVE